LPEGQKREDLKLLKIDILEITKALDRKIMEDLILRKKYLTMVGGCSRVRTAPTTDMWLLNIPGLVLFSFRFLVISKI
jgi:hypothetical protein